jgi:hypothetical protein
VGAFAVIGGLWMLAVMGGGSPSQAEVAPSASSAIVAKATPVPSNPSATGSPVAGSPGALPTPTATRVSSPAAATLTLSGAGDHGGVPVTLAGGRYEVSYVVSSPAGESCPWALYLTGSNGIDLLMASAYPVDETLRAAESDSFIPEGKATVRVESGCPRWSATVMRTGP